MHFLHADFTDDLPLPHAHFDLLIALYTGPAWDHCRRYLQPGGVFLANASHGDASLAALDPRAELVAAVLQDGHDLHLDRDDLSTYLTPRSPAAADRDAIRRTGRGIAKTPAGLRLRVPTDLTGAALPVPSLLRGAIAGRPRPRQ
ncbi:MAG: hypothetical protein WBP61_19330 [Nocardioides sp.]